MKFIHTADLHLDSPFLGLKQLPDTLWQQIYQSPVVAFTRLIDDAIKEKVDFVLISGDVYDRQDRDITAQMAFLIQMERLNQVQIPVYLSYGNHDYMTGTTDSLQLPPNVHEFAEAVSSFSLTTADQTHVRIVGFSYPTRNVTTDMAATFPERDETADIEIGMLHGSVSGMAGVHETDAPFTIPELVAKRYDYWALGHIHKREVLRDGQPWIIYPGNIQGRHINEPGAKGYYLVEHEKSALTPTFHAVAPIVWHAINVDCQTLMSSDDVMTAIKQALEQHEADDTLSLIVVTLAHARQLTAAVRERLDNGSLLGILQGQETVSLNERHQLVVDIRVAATSDAAPKVAQLDQTYWDQAAGHVFTTENVAATADQLFAEPAIAKALAHDTDEFKAIALEQINGLNNGSQEV